MPAACVARAPTWASSPSRPASSAGAPRPAACRGRWDRAAGRRGRRLSRKKPSAHFGPPDPSSPSRRFRLGSATMSRPQALREGDGIAVVAPSSPFDRDRFERGVRALQGMGFEPRFGEGVYARHAGYLAGPDTRRLDELLRALRDSSARAIVLARGGYGLLRIASKIPLGEISKPVVGYSDTTVLHELWWR